MPRSLTRFTSQIEVSGDPVSDCWIWKGRQTLDGYGARVQVNGRRALPYRLIYELVCGPVPAGFQLDHLCRNRLCVNPRHLEPVTSRENTMRGLVPTANRAICKNGLHLIAEVGIIVDSAGSERCHACRLASKQRSRRQLAA